jgi:hypothetical protein
LTDRQATVDRAVKILGKEGAGRQKAEALRGVISQVVCWFRHTATKEAKHNGKSYLENVEIVPIDGETRTFPVAQGVVINGIMPVQG